MEESNEKKLRIDDKNIATTLIQLIHIKEMCKSC